MSTHITRADLTSLATDTILADAQYVEDHPEMTPTEIAASLRRIAAQLLIDRTEIPDHPPM